MYAPAAKQEGRNDNIVKGMRLGQIVYYTLFRPAEIIRTTLRTGLLKTYLIQRSRKAMQKQALHLKELNGDQPHGITIHFLTGKKYWYQTAFCLYSFQQQADCAINAVLVDDGSFDDQLEQQIRKQFPRTVTIVRSNELVQRLDEVLPVARFPVLRNRRLVYPHLRKLTDVHVLSGSGPKLVLDSDMLFFKRPIQLLEWCRQPVGLLFMRDVEQSYGYSEALMKRLTGTTAIPQRINVGVAGIASHHVDWHQLEYWTKELLHHEGSSYLQEQGLTAMLAALHKHEVLEEQAYKVMPTISTVPVHEILHHYVADSKYDYFVKGWKVVLNNRPNAV